MRQTARRLHRYRRPTVLRYAAARRPLQTRSDSVPRIPTGEHWPPRADPGASPDSGTGRIGPRPRVRRRGIWLGMRLAARSESRRFFLDTGMRRVSLLGFRLTERGLGTTFPPQLCNDGFRMKGPCEVA